MQSKVQASLVKRLAGMKQESIDELEKFKARFETTKGVFNAQKDEFKKEVRSRQKGACCVSIQA